MTIQRRFEDCKKDNYYNEKISPLNVNRFGSNCLVFDKLDINNSNCIINEMTFETESNNKSRCNYMKCDTRKSFSQNKAILSDENIKLLKDAELFIEAKLINQMETNLEHRQAKNISIQNIFHISKKNNNSYKFAHSNENFLKLSEKEKNCFQSYKYKNINQLNIARNEKSFMNKNLDHEKMSNDNKTSIRQNIDGVNKTSRFSTYSNHSSCANISKNKPENSNTRNYINASNDHNNYILKNDNHLDQKDFKIDHNIKINLNKDLIKINSLQNEKFSKNEIFCDELVKNSSETKKKLIKKIDVKKIDRTKYIDHDFKRYIGRFKFKKMPQSDRYLPINDYIKQNLSKSTEKGNNSLVNSSNHNGYKRYNTSDFLVNKHRNNFSQQFQNNYNIQSNQKTYSSDNEQYRNIQNYKLGSNSRLFDFNSLNHKHNYYNLHINKQFNISKDHLRHTRHHFNDSYYSKRFENMKDETYFHPFLKISENHSRDRNSSTRDEFNFYPSNSRSVNINNNPLYPNSVLQNRTGSVKNEFNIETNKGDYNIIYEAAIGLLKLSRDVNKTY